MCNLSEGIAEEAYEKAWSEATKLSEGIAEEAREEGKIEMVLAYIRKKKISIDTALDDLDVPDVKRAQYTTRIQQLM